MAGRATRRRSVPGRGSSHNRTGALVSSSARYAGNRSPRVYGNDHGWQKECYRFYRTVGEAAQAANYYGAAMSKCDLYMKKPVISEDGRSKQWVASYDSQEAMVLDDLFSGRLNQGQALQQYGVNMFVGGECFILGKYVGDREAFDRSVAGDGSVQWEIASPVEMTNLGDGGWQQTVPGTGVVYRFTDLDTVIRIWREDPERREQAWSSFKANMAVLAEIEMLTQHIESQLTSRLAGAGILWVPEGIDLPSLPTDGEEEATNNGPSRLMKLIGKVGEVALKDRAAPQARVPIIIQAPDDLIDKAKLMHFWSDLDEKAADMREGSLHRWATGVDLPNELIEGMSESKGTGGGRSNGVSHWGQWEIAERAIKIHIEPAMDRFVAAITVDHIRAQVPKTDMQVAYGTAALKLRPDRSKEAFELYDRGLLKSTALFREVGFDESDLASDADRKALILWKLATGSATPDQVAAAAKVYGISLPLASMGGSGPPAAPAAELPPPPSLEDHPTRPRDPSENAALMVACHALCLQALSRVGNRCFRSRNRPAEGDVEAWSLHTKVVGDVDLSLLDGAFPQAREMLEGVADPADVMPALQDYCRQVLATKGVHTKAAMADYLEQAGVPA